MTTAELAVDAGPQANSAPCERAGASGPTLLNQLLREQRELTAAEAFARAHDAGEFPERAKHYRALLPAAPPGPGQQYAFDVDLDCCSGCKACVTACHALNGLDGDETWRDVGLLIGGTRSLPVIQHVTAACHHCLDPACLTACPVDAYEKDRHTGIVKHLDDQCFGCQYCTLACPYDVPKYHAARGIVRKCDMCSSRLAIGEAPACAQACPNQAIRIRVVDAAQVVEDAEAAPFLPAAPDPHITLPTTTYRTRRVLPRSTLPADYFTVSPQHPHLPLVAMLVLTQLSVGAFITGAGLQWGLPAGQWNVLRPVHASGAVLLGVVALAASTLHLGRPLLAYRAVIGIRHSWLSREIVAFGVFAALACAYAAAALVLKVPQGSGPRWLQALPWLVALAGVAGVFCSAMIYVATRRETWNPLQTFVKFGLTTALLGVAAVWLSLLLLAARPSQVIAPLLAAAGPNCARLIVVLAAAKLLWEAAAFRHLLSRRMTLMRRCALLMTRELANVTLARFALGLLGGVVMPAFLLQSVAPGTGGVSVPFLVSATILVVACTAGEFLERYLFFAAACAPRMPGGIR